MPVYLKIEASEQQTSLLDDLLGLSLIALLLSPWAIGGLIATLLEAAFVTPGMSIVSGIMLLAAIPKVVQLFLAASSDHRNGVAQITDPPMA